MRRGSDRGGATIGFESFYRRELPAMAGIAGVLVGSRDIGVELAQEAMLRAYRDWSRVSSLDRPGA